MQRTTVQYLWQSHSGLCRARTAVSLHSHTMHSEETLKDIPRYLRKVPMLERLFPRKDYSSLFWTPPLPARQAWDLEANQIEQGLGLGSLVSLTDHDNIQASTRLRLLGSACRTPVSFEWTVHLEPSFLHLGIHNLPEDSAHGWVGDLLHASARRDGSVAELLKKLHSLPEVLVVLNHPLWDEPEVGRQAHRRMLLDFMRRHGRWVHALEWNGLRPGAENRAVMELAQRSGHPVVAGGDRHGVTPNTVLNLTNAAAFEEFVWEVRRLRLSRILVLPSYRGPHWMRWLECATEVLREYPELAGRERWSDRVFVRSRGGASEALGEDWTDWFPEGIRSLAPVMALLRWGLRALPSSLPPSSGAANRFLRGA